MCSALSKIVCQTKCVQTHNNFSGFIEININSKPDKSFFISRDSTQRKTFPSQKGVGRPPEGGRTLRFIVPYH